jgi:two-component system sensor histidine kinase TctE
VRTTRPARGSLRLNLMAWLVMPVAIILGVSVWLSYGAAMRSATLVTDHQLIGSARMIAEEISYDQGEFTAVIPPSALELFASDSHDEVAFAVIDPKGELIAGYPGLSAPANAAAAPDEVYYETAFRDESMRATALTQPVMTPTGAAAVTVLVGETLKARNNLAESLWVRGFIEQALLVLAASLSIWVGINRQLRPLLNLRKAVLDQPADSFEPFDAQSVQSEVQPLVLALNSHMDRLKRQLERQTRFLDSAAHQLRTPLAIMKTQIGYARRTREPAEVGLALTGVDGNLTAMARLTNQLLTLSRVEHDGAAMPSETIDLAAIAKDLVAEAAPRALDRGIELVLDADQECPVLASSMLVREMLANLIDNVIEHAGAGATATISVKAGPAASELRIADDGAGVAPADRRGLFERFHRGSNARPGGSGLGLSIVAEIAGMLGGSVELPVAPDGRGFCVLVRLPSHTPSATPSPIQTAERRA